MKAKCVFTEGQSTSVSRVLVFTLSDNQKQNPTDERCLNVLNVPNEQRVAASALPHEVANKAATAVSLVALAAADDGLLA